MVSNGRETAVSAEREPRPTGLLVSTAERTGIAAGLRPPVCILRRTRVKFVAVSGDDQWQAVMNAMGDDDKADLQAPGLSSQ